MAVCPHCKRPLQLVPTGIREPTTAEQIRAAAAALRATLLEYLAVVGSTDVGAAARHAGSGGDPDRLLTERVRRALDKLVRDGTVSRSTTPVAGWNGGRMTTWTLNT